MIERFDTDLLAEFIGKKLGVLEQLRDLSRRQSTLIKENDMQRLLAVLSAKQTLLNELQKVQRSLEPFRLEDPDRRRWRSEAARQRCRQQAERSEALLSEIMLVERQSESEMSRRRDETVAKLQEFNSSADATRAYINTTGSQYSQLDLSSEH